ncbi:MAG: CBS domain-containing protein [Chloroflexi bacterium]|nr:CBS domain-containing protein [Chloroflexota bacterium]
MNITSILTKKGTAVFTARPEQTLRDALSLLAQHNIGALVVVDEAGRPVGILSERDIVREAARNEELFGKTVGAIMTRELTLGGPQDDLNSVANVMTARRIRHLPVVDGDRLIGIISIGDVMKAQRDEFQGEVDTLQIQLLKDPADPIRPR